MTKEKREPRPDAYPWEVGMVVTSEGRTLGGLMTGKVVRLTKTKVFVRFGNNYTQDFRRSDGWHKYDKFSWSSIRPATQDDLDTIKRNHLAYKLSKVKWTDLPLRTLTEIEKLVGEKVEGER